MANFGDTLKRERELRKITLREVSEATKIGLRYLEALEGNRFDQLPGGLFNKGFIRAYAKFVGLDPEALVHAYLFDFAAQQSVQPAQPPYSGLRIEEPTPPAAEEPQRPVAPSRRRTQAVVAAAAGLILIAGLCLITYRGSDSGERLAPRAPRVEKADLGGGTGVAPPKVEEESPAPLPAAASPTPPVAPPLALPVAPPAAAPAGTAIHPGERSREEVRKVLLEVTASETTWIAVWCGERERINKELTPGEVFALSCGAETRLSTGNAGTMTLRIDGNECLPLGERGAVIHDLVLNRESVAEICPSPAQEP